MCRSTSTNTGTVKLERRPAPAPAALPALPLVPATTAAPAGPNSTPVPLASWASSNKRSTCRQNSRERHAHASSVLASTRASKSDAVTCDTPAQADSTHRLMVHTESRSDTPSYATHQHKQTRHTVIRGTPAGAHAAIYGHWQEGTRVVRDGVGLENAVICADTTHVAKQLHLILTGGAQTQCC